MLKYEKKPLYLIFGLKNVCNGENGCDFIDP